MCMAFYISTMTHPGAVHVWRTLCRRGNPGIRRGTTNTAAFTPSRALPQSGISRLAAATTRSAKLLPEPRRPARPPAHPATTRAACCDPCAPSLYAGERGKACAEGHGHVRSREDHCT